MVEQGNMCNEFLKEGNNLVKEIFWRLYRIRKVGFPAACPYGSEATSKR
jgi:hypothetical protein